MGCGMFITPGPKSCRVRFRSRQAICRPIFLRSIPTYLDAVVPALPWPGLFLSLAAAGWSGYADHVERSIGLIALLKEQLIGLGWKVANALLWRFYASSRHQVRGMSVPSFAVFWIRVEHGFRWPHSRGREVIRVCVTNGKSCPTDIALLVQTLEANA